MSNDPLHIVLGSTGVIGQNIMTELKHLGIPCKGASRKPAQDGLRVELTNADITKKALAGASHAYLCAGLQYSTEVWKREWPQIMHNVILAAEANGTKVVFFDNIYMYGPPPLQNPITEDHPQAPSSKKGQIRKEIADELLSAHKGNRVKALIARCPDYYGPGATNSLVAVMMLEKMMAGKSPQWLGDIRAKHSFAYTIDAAKATVRLALDDGAYGQVWHLPAAAPTLSAEEFHYLIADHLDKKSKLRAIPKPVAGLLALFVPLLKEVGEVSYQSYSDYVFSSAKFQQRYPDFAITPYLEGIKETVKSFSQVH